MARPTLLRHRKFARLARLVGSRPLALGHLELLWSAAYESGDDRLGDATDVEAVSEWGGEAGKLVAAFVEAGFVDEARGKYRIHDFWHHAPDYVRKRRGREAARRAQGKKLQEVSESDRSTTGQWPPSPSSQSGDGRTPAPAPAPAPAQETFPATDVAAPPARLNGQKPRGQKPRNPALEALKDAMVKAHGETQNEGLSWPGSAWGELQEIRATLADDEEVLRRWKLFLVDRYWPIKNVHKFQVAYQHPKFKPPPVSAAGPKPQAIPVFR
jgi:hypothetical protein